MRIMVDPNTGFNRGYAFVRYVDKDSAKAAVDTLNDYEIRPGKKIKVNVSTPNLRLFVGNIPKTKSRDEIMEEFSKLTENLKDVIVYSTPDDMNTQRKNRGFCFLHFDSHIDAANAKKKLGRRGVRIFNSDIYVDWADPIDDNEEVNLSDVKILYVKNLSSDVTEDQVREAFGSHGPLEKVKRMKDYAFVHFEEREHALKAMEALNGHEGLGKGLLEVSLARPVSDKVKQKREQRKMEHHTHRWGGGAPAVGAAAFDGGAAGGFYNSRGVGAAPFRSGGRGGRCGGGGWSGGWGAANSAWGGGFSGGYWGGARAPAVGSFRGGGAPRYGAAAVGGAVYGASGFGGGGFRGGRGGGGGGFYNRPFSNNSGAQGGWRGRGGAVGGFGGGGGGGFRGGGGGGFGRGMKRKAQDGGPGGGGGGDFKRERREQQQQSRAADQDWTSDVTGNW
ncbi:hypothetical protein BOX15_Mlig003882g1 [Macrostomum lignano]|uniref:RRM domain-containing protein n=1 Tax=Macrostomum lignano TaxID=282301 RepID=A0A267E810_9PLAT|nr:hypothetical protein BOX15_Mlig003882g1 [Macrostomum lignano]